MVASAGTITAMRQRETAQMQNYLANVNATASGNTTIAGVPVIIYRESGNDLQELHLKSIRTAVQDVVAAGHAVPSLKVYLTSGNVPNVAMKTYNAGAPAPVIFLGPRMWGKNPKIKGTSNLVAGGSGTSGPRGVANAVYDGTQRWFGNPKQKAQGTAIVIHELGHVLHEINDPGTFWEVQEQIEQHAPIAVAPAWMAEAPNVSQYAGNNALEFVAEVFTGRLCGKNYAISVMGVYNNLGGP